MPLALLYLTAMLAGSLLIALGLVAPLLGLSLVVTITPVLFTVGVIAVIIFAAAIIYLGLRALLRNHFN